jgi:hypothetical protein
MESSMPLRVNFIIGITVGSVEEWLLVSVMGQPGKYVANQV